MTARRVDLASGFDEWSTESALALASDALGEPVAARFRAWAEAIDPRRARDDAIRGARALWPDLTITAASKRLADELSRYAATVWLRERATGPPSGASALRILLHRIARLTGGDGTIGDRQVLNILQSTKSDPLEIS